MKELYGLLVILAFFSCGEKNSNKSDGKILENEAGRTSLNDSFNKSNSIKEVVLAKNNTRWRSDSSTPSSRFHFSLYPDTLTIEYYPECWGNYAIKEKGDSLIAYWNDNLDTKYHFDIVGPVRQVGKQDDEPFLSFSLINDTTIRVSYLNSKIVESINNINSKRKFFPQQIIVED